MENVGFMNMLTDDGTTLVSVHQRDDGSLELITTPVTIIQHAYDTGPVQVLNTDNANLVFNQIQITSALPQIIQQPKIASVDVINVDTPAMQVASDQQCCCPEISNTLLPENVQQISNTKNITASNTVEAKQQRKENQAKNSQKSIETTSSKNNSSSKQCNSKSLDKSKKYSTNANGVIIYFKCEICGLGFRKQYLMQKHMQEHTQEKPHHCPKCPASFNVPINFTLHMATHNIGEPKCPQCGRKFARMASLKAHMAVHEVDENHYCTECESVFETKTQLDAHLKLHNEKWSTEDYKRSCKICRKQFTQPVLYRQHLRDHYKMQTKCPKQTKRGIRIGTVYKCRLCLKSFEKPSQLARHIRVHTGEKPYKCNLCTRSFSQKGSARIHMRQHNGIRPYSCSVCEAKFSQKGNLNAHILRVHKIQEGAPVYRCTRCPCVFKKLGSLNGHIRRAHAGATDKTTEESTEEIQETQDNVVDTKPVLDTVPDAESRELPKDVEDGFVLMNDDEQTAVVTLLDKTADDTKGKYIKLKQRFVNNSTEYECDFCHKVFKKPSDLMRHLRIHTRERPFKCKTCGRTFTLKSTLMTHEKLHEKAGKYICVICKKAFNTENALRTHDKSHNQARKCMICHKTFPTFKLLHEHTLARLGSGSSDCAKPQPLSEVQSSSLKVVLKEPLVLTELSGGVLHAQPKFGRTSKLAFTKGRPHKCSACPAAFTKLSHLKQHYRLHTGERPFGCTLCESTFTTNGALKAHRRTHDMSKPYQCTICNMNFSTLSSMKRHHATHSNKRPFMCPYCNKTFKTTMNCKKHIKLHKQEIMQQQIENQKGQEQSSNANLIKTTTTTDPITVVNNQQMSFKPVATDIAQNLNKQLQTSYASDLNSSIPQDIQISCHQGKNISVVENSNIGSTQTMHADETGTITLSNYMGDPTLTPESIRVIEETLNQQLSNIGLNMALNSSVRQIEEHNNISTVDRDQPTLSIIYDKTVTSPITTNAMNTNVFSPQFETFDINQITLQGDNEIDLGIIQNNSQNVTSILPAIINQNQNYSLQFVNNDLYASTILKQNQINQLKDNNQSNELVKVITSEQVCGSTNKSLDKENNLQCHICKMEELSADDLKKHLKTHKEINEFECTKCVTKFRTNAGLSRHMKTHDTQETHKCYECNQVFLTTLQLREHITEHVKRELKLNNVLDADSIPKNAKKKKKKKADEDKIQTCKYCPKTFRKPSDLIRHIRTHTGERPYQCQYCDKSFAVKCTLDSHLKLHQGAIPFKCSMCNLKFSTTSHRKAHEMTHKQKNKSTTNATATDENCEVLNIEKSAESLSDARIVQIVHSVPTPQQLEQQNTNSVILNSNNIAISPQISFSADDGSNLLTLNENNQLVANLEFLLANGLVNISSEGLQLPADEYIVQKVHGQPDQNSAQVIIANEIPNTSVQVNQDTQQDINNIQLNNCMVLSLDDFNAITGERNDENVLKEVDSPSATGRRHDCKECGKSFNKPGQLQRHMRVHTGERPFKCEICDKSFSQKSSLQLHQKSHTGERPHACPHCNQSFAQSCNLQTHIRRKHNVNSAKRQQLINVNHFDPSKNLTLDPQQHIFDKPVELQDISIVALLN